MESHFVIDSTLPANYGHLDITKWLHVNNGIFTQYTMDAAANHGYMDIVQWLHDNRTEGCTANAVDQAARNGHFHIVK